MSTTGSTVPTPRPPAPARRLPRLGACLAWMLLATVAALGCAAADEDVLPAAQPAAEPGFGHVHGLGVNPADGRLYAATHFGLWRSDDGTLERVGDAYHDLMGFTVLGEDEFAASGHPLLDEDDLPPLLGYIVSDDGGRTWRSVSLLGEADFHALEATDDGLYGYDSTTQRFLHSPDGVEWSARHTDRPITALAAEPADPRHLIAAEAPDLAGHEGNLIRSRDGGRSWEPSDGPAAVHVSWAAEGRLLAVDADGRLHTSEDAGEHWEQAGALPAVPGAILDHDGVLYADAHDRIVVSDDVGATWEDYATTAE